MPDDKKPLTPNGFRDATTDPKIVGDWWAKWPLAMIGVPMGARSGLFAIDPDAPDAENPTDGRAEWQRIASEHGMPHPHTRVHTTANGGWHVLYKWDPNRPIGNSKALDPSNIHCRGDGGYIIWAGSVNSDGLIYSAPDKIAPIEAPEWLYALLLPKPNGAAHGEEASHRAGTNGSGYDVEVERTRAYIDTAYYGELDRVRNALPGTRNNTLNDAAFRIGTLMVGSHLTMGIATDGLRRAAEACKLHTDSGGWPQIEKTIRSGLDAGLRAPPRKLDHVVGPNGSNGPTLLKVNGVPFGSAKAPAAEPIELPKAEDALDVWEAPEVPLPPLDLLPDYVRTYVETMSRSGGIDPAGCMMSALVSISGVLDHRIKMRARPGGRYVFTPSLWSMLVGDSGDRKTHPVDECVSTFEELDSEDYRTLKAAQEADPNNQDLQKQVARRRHIFDTTSEKLCEVLSHQDTGITIVRDELSGLIGAIDKYGGGNKGGQQDRSVLLSAHEGRPYRQDRMSGSRIIKHMSAGIFGGIQMRKLLELGNLDSDGLLQRFIPILMRPAVFSRQVEGEQAARLTMMTLLRHLNALQPVELTLSPDGQQLYDQLEKESLEDVQDGRVTVSDAYAEWTGKTMKRFAVFCIEFHALQSVIHRAPLDRPIDGNVARIAYDLIYRFVLPHGDSFYNSLNGSKGRGLFATVADAILRFQIEHPGKLIDMREMTHRASNLFRNLTRHERAEVASHFCNVGWLTPTGAIKENQWWVTPGLADRFKAQREERAASRARRQARLASRSENRS